ncbi:MAG: hypothetical protein ACW97P_03240 [Candidatus Hodarchaeales archaeon]
MVLEDDILNEPTYEVGDLVKYVETYVIPPDAVNWKFNKPPEDCFNLAIVVSDNAAAWDRQPPKRYKLYRIMHVKTGRMITCSGYNLRKAYLNDYNDEVEVNIAEVRSIED